MREKDLLGHDVEAKKIIKVSEKTLQQVSEQWQNINEKGKELWILILHQIDHPIAKRLLRKTTLD